MSATATAPMSEPTTTAAPAGQEQLPTAGVWRQTALLMRWQLRRSLPQLPLVMVVQTLMAVATVLGYGLIAGDAGHEAGLYLATGAPAISLITIGLIMAPQWVSQARTEGSLDWMRTLPVPRVSFLLADLLLWTVMALPGLVLGVAVGAARFDVALDPAWWLVPGALLVALTSACIGYAVANLLAPHGGQTQSQHKGQGHRRKRIQQRRNGQGEVSLQRDVSRGRDKGKAQRLKQQAVCRLGKDQ